MTNLELLQKARKLAHMGHGGIAFWLGCYAIDMCNGLNPEASLNKIRQIVEIDQ